MITEARIRNFQSLASADLELGTLTVLLGQNDLGKSATFRAIRAAAEGLSGTDFITYGKTTAKVTLVVDGHQVVWEKGPSINRYYIDGSLYDRVGVHVPPDVSRLLGMGPVDYGKDLKLNLNFADQDDPPFLIPFPGGMTPSAVATVLGDLTKLNVLFKAVHAADSRRRQSESALRVHRQDLTSLEAQLESFADVQDRLDHVDSLKISLDEASDSVNYLAKLEGYSNQLTDLRQRHAQIHVAEQALGPDLTNELTEVEAALEHYVTIERHHLQRHAYLSRGQTLNDQLEEADAALVQAHTAHRDLFATLEVCPLCEQPLTNIHAHA